MSDQAKTLKEAPFPDSLKSRIVLVNGNEEWSRFECLDCCEVWIEKKGQPISHLCRRIAKAGAT